MPLKLAAKTASERKRSLLRVGVVLLLVVLVVVVAYVYQGKTIACALELPAEGGKQCIQLERVDTPKARERGLGGRDSMPRNHGMLFVFQQDGAYCFWMKDTRFSLDMVWLDGDGRVVYVKHNVTPDTYPQSFCPNKKARYVIELNAGTARDIGIYEGQLIPVR
jgi:uncharacterized membrane protein (UPF0127 family)